MYNYVVLGVLEFALRVNNIIQFLNKQHNSQTLIYDLRVRWYYNNSLKFLLLYFFIQKLIIFQPERIRKRWQYNAIFYILRRLLNLKNPSTVWSVFIIYIKALLHIVSQLCDNLKIALWGRTPAVRAVARSSTGVRRPRMPTAVRTAAPGPQVDGVTRAAPLQRERTGRRTARLHLYSPRSRCASASLFVRDSSRIDAFHNGLLVNTVLPAAASASSQPVQPAENLPLSNCVHATDTAGGRENATRHCLDLLLTAFVTEVQ